MEVSDMPDLPGHDRREERRARRHGRRIIRDGDEYDILEEDNDEIELELPERREEPPVDIQGEPWGWTKPGPRPRGWPGPDVNRDEPGPYDGNWEPPREDR